MRGNRSLGPTLEYPRPQEDPLSLFASVSMPLSFVLSRALPQPIHLQLVSNVLRWPDPEAIQTEPGDVVFPESSGVVEKEPEPVREAEAEPIAVEDLPVFLLGQLIAGPIAPPAASHIIPLPLELFPLNRGAAQERKQPSKEFPAFKPSSFESLSGSSEPVFSFVPLPFNRKVKLAPKPKKSTRRVAPEAPTRMAVC
jgi:hypothetical protein